MIALETDAFTDAIYGEPVISARLAAVPIVDQSLPVVALEEVVRGRLNTIRQSEAGRGRITLDAAYELFRETIRDAGAYIVLPLTPAAILLVTAWKRQRIRVASHDIRIAAICIVHGATLITRNRRDYAQIPGLTFEVWN